MAHPPKQSNLSTLLNSAVQCLDNADIPQAEKLLSRALIIAPRDPNALQLMGVVRRAQNRIEEAESLYNRSLSIQPNQPQVLGNLGSLLLAQGRNKEAIAAQTHAIRLKPDYVEAHLNLAMALSCEGDHNGAIAACKRALQFQPGNVTARHLLATELLDARRPGEAETILREILADKHLAPQTAIPLKFNLALSLKQQGHHEEAVELFEALREYARQLPQLDYNIGEALFELRRYEAARDAFQRILSNEPENEKVLSRLALTSACLADFATARRLAQQAVALQGRSSLAAVVLALCEFSNGRWGDGIAIVEQVVADESVALDDWTNFALARAADRLDRQDRCDAAFSLTIAMNERKRRAAAYLEPLRAINDTRRLQTYFNRSPHWQAMAAPPAGPLAPAGHVFVLGFMRSGTTLVATALAGHEQVVAADEKDFFSEAAEAFLLNDKGLNTLAQFPQTEISRWTASYWEKVRARGFVVKGRVFVEKMPFNALRLPLIARFFPDAKILLALRDPRDVVLSCVRQQFDPTPFSYEFLRLSDCARFYVEAMQLIERYRQVLPLDLMAYRYEDVVADYPGTVGRLCDFTGLEWRDSMVRFSAASSFVDPLSASAQQVRKELYATSVGQWRRYRSQLEPVMSVLSPSISRLGYPSR